MSQNDDLNIDSQFIIENVSFLNNDFDISLNFSNLNTVKKYVAEEEEELSKVSCASRNSQYQKLALTFRDKSAVLNSTKLAIDDAKSCHDYAQHKKLSNWGLPNEIVQKYAVRGIEEMFDWQVSCLKNSKVLMDGSNLVYSAPTSAGKTLVAEILTIKTVLERQKRVIIILPFVSIVREKMFYLQSILSSSGVRVEGFMGSHSPPGGLQSVHIAICTIEKANSLVNRLLDEGNIAELGAVIVDELHMLGDPHRGYILELLLTKIKYVSLKFEGVHIQIIGMSATLPNLEALSKWLNAELFVTQFRPIPLDEYCLVGNQLYNKIGDPIKTIDLSITQNDNVLQICFDTVKEGCSILIFCMTKNWCENLAQSVASAFYKLGCSGNEQGAILREQLKTEQILEVLEQLKNCPVGLDSVLKSTVSFGVAYHHAGLTFDERDIIEGAFKTGALRVLVATSTLSSGVNLPARKVIIRSPVFQRQPINILTYKQMVGRAGRMGRDTMGESIVICTEGEKNIAFELMMGTLNPVVSCIEHEDKYMRAILEVIASQVACTKSDLDLYTRCTLLFDQQENIQTDNNLLNNTLDQLKNFELIRLQDDNRDMTFVASPLGKACLSSSMAPNDGLSLFCELQKARQCLVLETDLHLIYLVTPYSVSNQWSNIDWLHLLSLWESLTKAMKRVGELVGIQESFIIRCVRGVNKLANAQNMMHVHKRFYTALALQDLVNEVPLSVVANKFQCPRGFLQSLQQAAATFAGMVTTFCHQLGWKNMEMLFSQFQDRLHFGIHSELLDLMKLSSLNGMRARSLYNSGFETVSSIALADVNTIENALHLAIPFQSEKEREDDDIDDTKKRNKIKNIWVTGYCGLTTRQAAENLIIEAQQHLRREIGVDEIKWKSELMLNNSKMKCLNSENNILNAENNNVIDSQQFYNDPHESKNITLECKTHKKFEDTSTTEINQITPSIDVHVIECKSIDSCKVTSLSDDKKTEEKPCLESAVWDSLNFTENALENISKLRISDQLWSSPNSSYNSTTLFADGNCNTVECLKPQSFTVNNRDISLFSSDEGNNSSLFEDSLPLDLLPSKLFDNNNSILNNYQNNVETHKRRSYNNTSLDRLNKTQLILDDDERIKSLHSKENNISQSNSHKSLNWSEDFEIMSEDFEILSTQETIASRKSDINCSFKCSEFMPKVKKIKLEKLKNKSLKKSLLPPLDSVHSKKFTLHIYNKDVKCFYLHDNDAIQALSMFHDIKDMSLIFNIEKKVPANLIGTNVIGKCEPQLGVQETSLNDNPLSIALFVSQEYCIYFDFNLSETKMKLVKKTLANLFQKTDLTVSMFSSKQTSFDFKKHFNLELPNSCIDVCLLEWLIDSNDKEPSLDYLARKYLDFDVSSANIINGKETKGYNKFSQLERLCARVSTIWHVSAEQLKTLEQQCPNVTNILDLEIRVAKILSHCEYNGIAIDRELASQLLIDVQNSQSILQQMAYKLCGYHFNFNSSKEVAKVLGIYKGRKVSTKKSILTSHNTQISSVIIFWRKLNAILTKTLYPLTANAAIQSDVGRINPTYTMHTSSGRISMHEPNLQNVPRTFTIPVGFLSPGNGFDNNGDVVEFNCRNMFKSTPGYVLVSADYCQLEMRILTHYCTDVILTKIMSSDVDVFKSIAASWGSVAEEEVDEDLRQKAKQLCYGIIYGMGSRTLGQLLDVSEMEASVFMDTFHRTYPAIKTFIQKVVEVCRKRGYIETLMKRRRYLPHINSKILAKKNAAERQAVNTTIQGSAADIAKAAMCAIAMKTQSETEENRPRLILQLHDELIYEVPEHRKNTFINTLKDSMENTIRLNVPLPVKVKSGYTWGTLEPYL